MLFTSLVAAAAAATGAAAKKKKIGKLGPMMEKKEIPVETDVNKLVNYLCGGNINKTGQDIKVSENMTFFFVQIHSPISSRAKLPVGIK